MQVLYLLIDNYLVYYYSTKQSACGFYLFLQGVFFFNDIAYCSGQEESF